MVNSQLALAKRLRIKNNYQWAPIALYVNYALERISLALDSAAPALPSLRIPTADTSQVKQTRNEKTIANPKEEAKHKDKLHKRREKYALTRALVPPHTPTPTTGESPLQQLDQNIPEK